MIRALRSIISNIVTLLLALVVAIIIWFNASQVEEALVRQTIQTPINIVGIPEDGTIIEPNLETLQPLIIGFEGPESVVSELTADNFAATIDLSGVPYAEEIDVPVQVQVSTTEEIAIIFQSTEVVTVLLEQSISREIPIELDIRGTVARGHTQGTPLIDPPFITASGPTSAVEQLSTIRLTVFLNNARETQLYSPSQLIFYDLQGRVASTRGLTLSAEEVEVTIPINESAGFAEKFITVTRVGEPASGYRLLNVSVEPGSVFVTGPPTQLEALTRVETERIDITGLTESVRLQVALDLPEGIRLDQDQEVFVDIEIEPRFDTANFRRDVEILGLDPELEVSDLDPENVRVTFFGPVLVLEALLESDIRVTVDLFELEAGTYSVVPEVVFPEQRGIELRSIQPSVITVEITQVQSITETITNTLAISGMSLWPQNVSGKATASPGLHLPDVALLPYLAYDPPFARLARREGI
jgi:YbbR domain-containing protein